MTGETDWQRHARWSLGELSDAEYADALVADGVPADDPLILSLRNRAARQGYGPPYVENAYKPVTEEVDEDG